MTDTSLAERNRANARKSTGPRSAAGKAIASRNALRHGVLADTPVIPDLEQPADWQEHRSGILDALHPDGALEVALAERIALALWRLARLARAEQASVALDQVNLEEQSERTSLRSRPTLSDARSSLSSYNELLRALDRLPLLDENAVIASGIAISLLGAIADAGDVEDIDELRYPFVPRDELVSDVEDWTAALLRQAIGFVAKEAGKQVEQVTALALGEIRRRVAAAKTTLAETERRSQLQRLARLVPDARASESFARYEAHLSRQWTQALHELERLQAARAGMPIVPPIVVDLTVEGVVEADST
jgi:hypothetical protein